MPVDENWSLWLFCSESHQGILLSPATTLLTSTNHELYICQQLDVGLLIGLVEMRAVTVNLTTPSHTLMPTQLRFPRCHRSRFGWSLNQAFVGAWSSSVNLSQQNPTRHTSPQGGSNSRKIGGAAPRGHVMESFFLSVHVAWCSAHVDSYCMSAALKVERNRSVEKNAAILKSDFVDSKSRRLQRPNRHCLSKQRLLGTDL